MRGGNKYRAVKAQCGAGHVHASRREARRCDALHLLQHSRVIVGLEQQPKFTFVINGVPIVLANGHKAALTADFSYIENGVKVVEEVKGMVVRDFPLRWALAKHLWPNIEWRIT